MSHLVFVFGTLKEGFPNFRTNKGSRIGSKYRTVQALPLYLVGDRHTPWLLDQPGTGEPVIGELYEVTIETLRAMDALERVGEPDGYVRKAIQVIPVTNEASESADAFVYLKPAAQLDASQVKLGPIAEYSSAHAQLYRPRAA